MKTKKSAAPAALKTTDKKSTSKAPIVAVSAPKAAASESKPAATAPVAVASAPKPAVVAPVAVASTPKPVVIAPIAVASTPKPVTSAPKPTPESVTTIDVKIDVGFGNVVFLRGQGAGLTWEQGVPLSCVDGGTWRWSQTLASPITFKVLLNDQVWSAGNDFVAAPGQKVEVSPSFA